MGFQKVINAIQQYFCPHYWEPESVERMGSNKFKVTKRCFVCGKVITKTTK